jgi:alginate O-acetyltransferase complex protein AlgJ
MVMKHRGERILGSCMVLFLVAGVVLTFLNPAVRELDPDLIAGPVPSTETGVVSGEWSARFQARYEQELLLRDPAVRIWGSLKYVLFREGLPGVLTGNDGWLFTTEEFQTYPEEDRELNLKLEFVLRVNRYLEERGIGLVVVLVPSKARVYSGFLGRYSLPEKAGLRYSKFRDSLVSAGIVSPDINALLGHSAENGSVYLRTDTHWTPRGARITADRVAAVGVPVLDAADSVRRAT